MFFTILESLDPPQKQLAALGELWEALGELWGALEELWEALGELWEGLEELWEALYIDKLPINRTAAVMLAKEL